MVVWKCILQKFQTALPVKPGTCDLPAKAMVFNMTQYNGYYGCTHCLQSGQQLATGERGTVHVYQYIHDNPTGPKRTSQKG